jgi:hypothetical protein
LKSPYDSGLSAGISGVMKYGRTEPMKKKLIVEFVNIYASKRAKGPAKFRQFLASESSCR